MEENKVRGPDLEKYLEGRHHNYITYAQGARFYNLPYKELNKLIIQSFYLLRTIS